MVLNYIMLKEFKQNLFAALFMIASKLRHYQADIMTTLISTLLRCVMVQWFIPDVGRIYVQSWFTRNGMVSKIMFHWGQTIIFPSVEGVKLIWSESVLSLLRRRCSAPLGYSIKWQLICWTWGEPSYQTRMSNYSTLQELCPWFVFCCVLC